jgi:hypothetical protein
MATSNMFLVNGGPVLIHYEYITDGYQFPLIGRRKDTYLCDPKAMTSRDASLKEHYGCKTSYVLLVLCALAGYHCSRSLYCIVSMGYAMGTIIPEVIT